MSSDQRVPSHAITSRVTDLQPLPPHTTGDPMPLTATPPACTAWCYHPGHDPADPCISDTPEDTLLTPNGEVTFYLIRNPDGSQAVQVETTGVDGKLTALTADVAEAREWFAAGLAACDLGDGDTLNGGRPAVAV